jgi:H+/Cl- antiporter ClcA
VGREEKAISHNANAGSVRNAIRWGLFLAAVGTIGFRLPRLFGELRQWREALRSDDAISAENWHTILKVDALASLIVLALGLAVFYFLRPRNKAAQ